ncbi:MAG: hypothetical protein Fur0014_18790 [Rubrivivax sp.]
MRRLRLLRACLTLLPMPIPALAPAAERPDHAPARGGTLVILGGAVKDGNDALWQAVVQAAGGPGALVLVLPTASSDPERAAVWSPAPAPAPP